MTVLYEPVNQQTVSNPNHLEFPAGFQHQRFLEPNAGKKDTDQGAKSQLQATRLQKRI